MERLGLRDPAISLQPEPFPAGASPVSVSVTELPSKGGSRCGLAVAVVMSSPSLETHKKGQVTG